MALTPTSSRSVAPSGTASGDLAGSYPGPTLAAVGSATGPIGSTTVAPVVTIDTKGRVTALTSANIAQQVTGPQTAIVDLNLGTLVLLTDVITALGTFQTKFNTLLAELRTAGLLAS